MNTLASPAFNPLRFANRLKEAGVSAKQAEAEAEVLHDALAAQAQAMSALESQFKTLADDVRRDAEQNATKGDLRELRAELKSDMALMRKDMEAMENRLVVRLTKVMITVMSITAGVVGCIAAVIRLLS